MFYMQLWQTTCPNVIMIDRKPSYQISMVKNESLTWLQNIGDLSISKINKYGN